MRKTAFMIVLATVILLAGHGLANAHQPTVPQVLEMLNHKAMRQQTGIEEATIANILSRLLIIKVNQRWYKLTTLERKQLAKWWSKTWTSAFPDGTVAIIDAVTADTVVNFHPSGEVSLIVRMMDP